MKTKKCYGCKQSFLREELINYASPSGATLYSYCPKCYQEKISRDKFAQKVCVIFGLKTPGPRIWAERKRLINTYGYTDDTIIDCLDYIYNIENKKKLSESICLVNPTTINRMLKYKQVKAQQITQSLNTQTKDYVVPIKENTTKKVEWDPDDWLDDDE